MQILVNGEAIDLRGSLSVDQLLRKRGLSGRRIAVEVNGEIVPRSEHADRRLREGDRVEIVQAIGGGT